MAKKVFKVQLDLSKSVFKIQVSKGFKFLSAQIQLGVPTFWYEIDADEESLKTRENVILKLYSTNETMNDIKSEYLGTYLLNHGQNVKHLYRSFDIDQQNNTTI